MPVTVRRIGSKYRIVDPSSGKPEMTPQGHPRDGGGHATRGQALRQMRAMNAAAEDPNWREKYPKKKARKSILTRVFFPNGIPKSLLPHARAADTPNTA